MKEAEAREQAAREGSEQSSARRDGRAKSPHWRRNCMLPRRRCACPKHRSASRRWPPGAEAPEARASCVRDAAQVEGRPAATGQLPRRHWPRPEARARRRGRRRRAQGNWRRSAGNWRRRRSRHRLWGDRRRLLPSRRVGAGRRCGRQPVARYRAAACASSFLSRCWLRSNPGKPWARCDGCAEPVRATIDFISPEADIRRR